MAIINSDMSNPRKNPQEVYDSQYLLGTILTAGSVSSTFDISGWTKFALKLDPNGGTFLGGTVITVLAAPTQSGPFGTVYGTTGAVASTLQFGSVGTQIITGLVTIEPLRFVQFALGGTQDAARTLTLIVK